MADGRVNVKDFGAVGDGITPDTAAVQAAIAAAYATASQGARTIYFPAGRYLIWCTENPLAPDPIYVGDPTGPGLTWVGDGIGVSELLLMPKMTPPAPPDPAFLASTVGIFVAPNTSLHVQGMTVRQVLGDAPLTPFRVILHGISALRDAAVTLVDCELVGQYPYKSDRHRSNLRAIRTTFSANDAFVLLVNGGATTPSAHMSQCDLSGDTSHAIYVGETWNVRLTDVQITRAPGYGYHQYTSGETPPYPPRSDYVFLDRTVFRGEVESQVINSTRSAEIAPSPQIHLLDCAFKVKHVGVVAYGDATFTGCSFVPMAGAIAAIADNSGTADNAVSVVGSTFAPGFASAAERIDNTETPVPSLLWSFAACSFSAAAPGPTNGIRNDRGDLHVLACDFGPGPANTRQVKVASGLLHVLDTHLQDGMLRIESALGDFTVTLVRCAFESGPAAYFGLVVGSSGRLYGRECEIPTPGFTFSSSKAKLKGALVPRAGAIAGASVGILGLQPNHSLVHMSGSGVVTGMIPAAPTPVAQHEHARAFTGPWYLVAVGAWSTTPNDPGTPTPGRIAAVQTTAPRVAGQIYTFFLDPSDANWRELI